MYTALYRTERPENFDQVLGQDHIVRILKNQVKNGTVGHAYLFCGTRGTGKTSVARILAKAVNCTGFDEPELGSAAGINAASQGSAPGQIGFDVAEANQSAGMNQAAETNHPAGKPCCKCPNCIAIQNGNFLDVIEIDAASNNGVDNVRELRESVNYPPSVGKRKVYIIDEAHELTTHALNALLKTLEEPPENVMFILATTDPQKLIQTILSRCLRLDFHRISEPELKRHMANICAKRNVEITEDALNLLTANADGSARDALSLLDQCLSGVSGGDLTQQSGVLGADSPRQSGMPGADASQPGTTGADSLQPRAILNRETVLECLGTVSDDFFIKLTDNVNRGDAAAGLLMLDEVLRDGKDVKQIMADWMGHYRSLLIGKYVAAPENILNLSAENVSRLAAQAKSMPLESINKGIMILAETVNNARYSPQPRILMELAIVTLSTAEGSAKNVQTPNFDENTRAEHQKDGLRTFSEVNDQAKNVQTPNFDENARAEHQKDGLRTFSEVNDQARNVEPQIFVKSMRGNNEDQNIYAQTAMAAEPDTQTATPATTDVDTEPVAAAATDVDTQPATATAPNDSDEQIENKLGDLRAIWADVWDKIDDLGSVTMVRINSTLAGINDKEFKLLIKNRVTMNIAEKNRQQLEDAMESIIGRRLKMIIKEVDPSELNQDEGIQESLFRDGTLNAQPGYSQLAGQQIANGALNQAAAGREDESLWDDAPGTYAESGAEPGAASDINDENSHDEALKKEIESVLNINVRIED